MVVLHIYSAYALQSVTDIGVGKLSYLVCRYDIGDIEIALLHVDGSLLTGENACHDYLSQLLRRVFHHDVEDDIAAFYSHNFLRWRKTYIRHFQRMVAF